MDRIQRILDFATIVRYDAYYRHRRLGVGALCAILCACNEPGVVSPATVWSGLEPAVVYDAAGTTLTRLGAAQVIGDAGVDLLLVARGDHSARLLPGTQAGTLGAAIKIVIGSDTRDVTTADVNADGILDLVATGHFDNAMFVRLGIGANQFAAETAYPLRNHGHFVLRANLNGDAFDDVVAVHDGSGQPVFVTAFLGSPSGSLARAWEVGTTSYTAKGATRGDFDGDGLIDIAVAVADNRASALIFSGHGDGTFGPVTTIPSLSSDPQLSDGTASLATGDLDRDGRDDLVLTRQDAANELVVRLAASQFAPARVPLPSPIAVAVGDVNGDGVLDVAAANLEHGSISLLLGTGNGTFMAPFDVAVGQEPAWIVVVDLNRDGLSDVVVTDLADHRVRVLLSR